MIFVYVGIKDMIDNTHAVIPCKRFTDSINELRKTYCDRLIAIAREDSRIVAVEADVMSSMGTTGFASEFPERSINCGIQEANAVAMAAAMSLEGFIPFFHAFGPFATRRVFDQVFLSCGYQHANVKIIGGDAGISATANGGTHMPLEDISLMRNIPDMTILEPADTVAMKSAVPQMVANQGNVYCRSTRKKVIDVYHENARFEIGEASLVRDGNDVVIFTSGIMLPESLAAADRLLDECISAAVIDLFCIQPADTIAILTYLEKCKAAVTVENHSVNGGLGSLICEIAAEKYPVPIQRIGVRNSYGEVGTIESLKDRFHMNAADIINASKEVIRRKEM